MSLQVLLFQPDALITNPVAMQELLACCLQPPKAHHEASMYYSTSTAAQGGRDVPRVRVRCREHIHLLVVPLLNGKLPDHRFAEHMLFGYCPVTGLMEKP